jgi:hypothetical protein
MTRRSIRLVLAVCAALATGCGEDRAVEPVPSRLDWLEVGSDELILLSTAPGNTHQLTIDAYDQSGRRIPNPSGVSYSSSAPEAVKVSSDGIVTGMAPGSSEITASLSLGGVTRTAPVVVLVHERGATPIGAYELTAPITSIGPASIDLTGYRYTAVLMFEKGSSHAASIGPTFVDLSLVGPGGTSWIANGAIHSYQGHEGDPFIELASDVGFTLVLEWDRAAPVVEGHWWAPAVGGEFGAVGPVSGTFTAKRREE